MNSRSSLFLLQSSRSWTLVFIILAGSITASLQAMDQPATQGATPATLPALDLSGLSPEVAEAYVNTQNKRLVLIKQALAQQAAAQAAWDRADFWGKTGIFAKDTFINNWKWAVGFGLSTTPILIAALIARKHAGQKSPEEAAFEAHAKEQLARLQKATRGLSLQTKSEAARE